MWLIWRETFRGVWDTLRANRLRFLLTLSGIVVGSASLVLLSGLLHAGQEALMMAAHTAGEKDLVEVKRRQAPEKQQRRTTRSLDRGDVATLRESALLEEARVVGLRPVWEEAHWKGEHRGVAVVGTRGDALDLYRLKLEQGRYFNRDDHAERRRVAVVGHRVWTELLQRNKDFGSLEIKAGGERLIVVGVLAKKPSLKGGDGPWQWDNRVLVPEATFEVMFPLPHGTERRGIDRIYVRLGELRHLADRIGQVRSVVKSTILRRHYGVKNFAIEGEESDDGEDDMILKVISMLVLATAGISLTVGGINVMNIMLVSVTERTREIGIRRTVGASRGRILSQFLAESTLTATLGGVLGVAIGAGLTYVAALILAKLTGGWTFYLVPWAPPLALGTAMFVGAAFGVYPAWRASRLDPSEALRYE
jgi:putative ABC transport system permease protein